MPIAVRAVHLACMAFAALAAAAGQKAASLPDRAYSPLELYNGRWRLTPVGGKPMLIENHCARTGVFYVCEQVADGIAAALLVFQPTGVTANRLTYRLQTLGTDGAEPSLWSTIVIEGDQWVYSSPVRPGGGGMRRRTLNAFFGRDRIHYTVQHSADGVNWITDSQGDEQRI